MSMMKFEMIQVMKVVAARHSLRTKAIH